MTLFNPEDAISGEKAREIRRERIANALGHNRRLTTLEARHFLEELTDWISTDPEHDPATHLGVMSADMSECRQCYAVMQLAGLRNFILFGREDAPA